MSPIESEHDKTYKTYMDSKDLDQSEHLHVPSMTRVLVYHSFDSLEDVEGSCYQRKLWSDCADAQADLSLRWSHKSNCRFHPALAQFIFYMQCYKSISEWHNRVAQSSRGTLQHRNRIGKELYFRYIQTILFIPTFDTMTKFVIITIRLPRNLRLRDDIGHKLCKKHMFWIIARLASVRRFGNKCCRWSL